MEVMDSAYSRRNGYVVLYRSSGFLTDYYTVQTTDNHGTWTRYEGSNLDEATRQFESWSY